jgi:precorrin-6B methylase 2
VTDQAPKLSERKFRSYRRFDYDRRLLPNPYLAELEPDGTDLATAANQTGLTVGYPSWNLLYYALFCSPQPDPSVRGPVPPPIPRDLVVVETGTNWGASTIVMAQALKDLGTTAKVRTVDINESLVEKARRNVENAGLTDHVEFHVEDSLAFLARTAAEVDQFDFIFIDDDHAAEHVIKELTIVCPKVAQKTGKIYFDNTSGRGVSAALRHLKETYGGNLLEFPNCSFAPPGNAIWQPG